MAVTVVQHATAANALNANTIAATITATGTGNLLVVTTGAAVAATSVAGVSDGTNAFTRAAGAAAVITGVLFTDVWYLMNSTAGKTTITVTFSAGAGVYSKNIHVWEVAGFVAPVLDTSGAVSDATGSGNTLSGPSLVTAGAIGFGAAAVFSFGGVNQNPKTGNAWTAGGDIDALTQGGVSILTVAPGTYQAQWNDPTATDTYCASAVAFKDTPLLLPLALTPMYQAFIAQ